MNSMWKDQAQSAASRWNFNRIFDLLRGSKRLADTHVVTWVDSTNLAFARLIVTQCFRSLFLSPVFQVYLAYESSAATFITYVLSTVFMSLLSDRFVLNLEKVALETLFNYALMIGALVLAWTVKDITSVTCTYMVKYGRFAVRAFWETDFCWFQSGMDTVTAMFTENDINTNRRPRYQGLMRYLGLMQPSPSADERSGQPAQQMGHARGTVSLPEMVDLSSTTRAFEQASPTNVLLNSNPANQGFLRVTRNGTVFGSYPAAPQTTRSGRPYVIRQSSASGRLLTIGQAPDRQQHAKSMITLPSRLPNTERSQAASAIQTASTGIRSLRTTRTTRSGNAFGYYCVAGGDQTKLTEVQQVPGPQRNVVNTRPKPEPSVPESDVSSIQGSEFSTSTTSTLHALLYRKIPTRKQNSNKK